MTPQDPAAFSNDLISMSNLQVFNEPAPIDVSQWALKRQEPKFTTAPLFKAPPLKKGRKKLLPAGKTMLRDIVVGFL